MDVPRKWRFFAVWLWLWISSCNDATNDPFFDNFLIICRYFSGVGPDPAVAFFLSQFLYPIGDATWYLATLLPCHWTLESVNYFLRWGRGSSRSYRCCRLFSYYGLFLDPTGGKSGNASYQMFQRKDVIRNSGFVSVSCVGIDVSPNICLRVVGDCVKNESSICMWYLHRQRLILEENTPTVIDGLHAIILKP